MSDANPWQYSDSPGDDRYPDVVILDDSKGRIEFRPEEFFGWRHVWKLRLLSALLVYVFSGIIGLSFLLNIISLPWSNGYLFFLGILLLILSLLVFFLFIPWWAYPNFLVPRIISKFHKITPGKGYICQFTTRPSRYKGLRKLENADDLGVLYLEDDHLLFEGDHTTAVIPYSCTESVDLKNAGFARSGWLGYYLRIYLTQEAGQPFQYILIGDRAAKTLLGSYRTICKIRDEIKESRKTSCPKNSSPKR